MREKDNEALSSGPASQESGPRNRARLRNVSRSLPVALLRTREAVMRQFRPVLRSVDLTEQQWRVLRALDSVPEIDATGLAMATFLLPPSLSRILRDLEKRHLISRRPDPADLRAWLISLTPEGKRVIDTAGTQAETIYAAITDRIGQERLDTLMQLLRDIEQDLNAPLTDDDAAAERGE
ncbi:homoprotocatechuate degradation operon regulator HpaR [Pleomorphomonas sp. NRK KF1]|uniref:homoprotocatechuate degradation operon regulator HpaR n=1 Tax=Pleomorphomonas sp. NRK KF1 TaxID=2943000 RepID=UPI002043776A|nr:homoprotocatechuate degradation operon regulator HpaR [Pleomorphomonas sp. NRK KF1]MCM5553134.1 homoprotocatechuate degradation operon regulator HpaR [Pleomorphomonas sp. NRK KF1]